MRLPRTAFRHRRVSPGRQTTGCDPSSERHLSPDPESLHEVSAPNVEGSVVLVDEAVAALEPYLQEQVIPTGRVINPLLDVWSAARSLDPSVARPVEDLLTALVSRHSTNPAELVATLDQVRVEAVQASVRADALSSSRGKR